MIARARALRASATSAETLLWSHLRRRALGLRFRRQQPIGPYVVDFYCHAARLVIELDGGQHLERELKERDEVRDRALVRRGLRVMRFFNDEVLRDLAGVLAAIDRVLESASERTAPLPSPLPRGEGTS